MSKHTSFASFEEMCGAAGVTTQAEFAALPDAQWDDHVRQHTTFSDWPAMQKAAVQAFGNRRLRAGL